MRFPGLAPKPNAQCLCNNMWIEFHHWDAFGIKEGDLIRYSRHGWQYCKTCNHSTWYFTSREAELRWRKAIKTYGAFKLFDDAANPDRPHTSQVHAMSGSCAAVQTIQKAVVHFGVCAQQAGKAFASLNAAMNNIGSIFLKGRR